MNFANVIVNSHIYEGWKERKGKRTEERRAIIKGIASPNGHYSISNRFDQSMYFWTALKASSLDSCEQSGSPHRRRESETEPYKLTTRPIISFLKCEKRGQWRRKCSLSSILPHLQRGLSIRLRWNKWAFKELACVLSRVWYICPRLLPQ